MKLGVGNNFESEKNCIKNHVPQEFSPSWGTGLKATPRRKSSKLEK